MRMIRRCISTAMMMLLHLGMLFINYKTVFFNICDSMRRNALKVNEHKQNFVIFSTKNNLRDNQCLVVGKDKIEVSDYVKILGVTFDNRMTLQKHITNICRSVNMHIRKINNIRRYLSNTAARTLGTIDGYCSSRLL